MNQKVFIITGVVLVCLVLAAVSGGRQLLADMQGGSGVPGLISYQGFLADGNGDPVADGSYPMNYAMWLMKT